MEIFQTNVFLKTKAKTRKRLLYNLGIFGAVFAMWMLYFIGIPGTGIRVGLMTVIPFTITLLGIKIYDDSSAGITAYGERKDQLLIAEDYLQIGETRFHYTDLNDLVIYVEEYLGMPKEIYGIHHGGNNLIEFKHNEKLIAFNYVIKNKQDFGKVSALVDRIEKNPVFQKHLRQL